MTMLEKVFFAGYYKVFGYGEYFEWWTEFSHEEAYTHYAEILDKGRQLGPWKPLEVVEND
jgi:hypothetical protein